MNESVDFEEEAYIDDLPFNTRMIAAMLIDYNQEDEEYIDDIPFNTYEIAIEKLVDITCFAIVR